jgi:integrase
MHRETIYKHWKKLCPDMTFHQLRHVFATTGAMLGIPSRVMQEMGGWKTPYTMQRVYQHTFDEERNSAQQAINEYMERYLT